MGIMEALNFMVNNGFLNINTNGSIYVFAQLFSNTAYTFLPILIAYSGAKVFGANPYLGAVIGIMTFIVLAIVSLITYHNTTSYKDEEGFQ